MKRSQRSPRPNVSAYERYGEKSLVWATSPKRLVAPVVFSPEQLVASAKSTLMSDLEADMMRALRAEEIAALEPVEYDVASREYVLPNGERMTSPVVAGERAIALARAS